MKFHAQTGGSTLTAQHVENNVVRVSYQALAAVRAAATGNDNVMPPTADAVKAYATVGEVSDVLRDEFGEYQPQL